MKNNSTSYTALNSRQQGDIKYYTMYTFIYLIVEVIIFTVVIIGFYTILKRVTSWKYLIYSLSLPVIIYMLAEGFNKTHQVLREKGYFIELGHSSLINVVLWVLFMASALIIIFYFGIKKIKNR